MFCALRCYCLLLEVIIGLVFLAFIYEAWRSLASETGGLMLRLSQLSLTCLCVTVAYHLHAKSCNLKDRALMNFGADRYLVPCAPNIALEYDSFLSMTLI